MEIICHTDLLTLFLNIFSNDVDSQEVIRDNAVGRYSISTQIKKKDLMLQKMALFKIKYSQSLLDFYFWALFFKELKVLKIFFLYVILNNSNILFMFTILLN